MAKSSQSNQPKKGKGIILREAVSLFAGVFLLLLGPDAVFARTVDTIWTPNTDDTTGYRMRVKEASAADWQQYVDIPGRETAAYTVQLKYGVEYELGLAATLLEKGLVSEYTENVFVADDVGTVELGKPGGFALKEAQ